MDRDTARQRSRIYADLAHAFSEAEPGLELEFTRLFLEPGRPVAHPYESVYREGRTMGETTLDVRRRLVEEGLAPSSQRLPDHVGIELAFMAHLVTRETLAWDAGEGDLAWRLLQEQESFLSEHLGAWLPQFCHRILAGRPLIHYARLAQRAEAFVLKDLAKIQGWLGKGMEAAEGSATDREWWTVVVGQRCTLCHLCVEMCQTGALHGVRDEQEGMISLSLDPVNCDGCAACERWCPEGVISVRRVHDDPPGRIELAHSALLACPMCGRLHVPEAMISAIVPLLGPAQEALAQRLLICYDCKVMDVPLRRSGATQHVVTSASGDEPLSLRRST